MTTTDIFHRCRHCEGHGYHGNGAAFDEDTRRWFPTDCGCCAGRGEHRTPPGESWPYGRCFGEIPIVQ